MSLVADGHFTAFIYCPGSGNVEYGDSMHHQPPRDIISVLQWIFFGLFEMTISTIDLGLIPKQGPGSGEGSCGIIAHNFMAVALGTHGDRVRRWSGFEYELFRNVALQDLILFHYTAGQTAGNFVAWTYPILNTLNAGTEVNTSMGSGFNDFNNFSPNVSLFFLIYRSHSSYYQKLQ
ncbi:hypothetical protein BYT27DRAFT_7080848 [Phlegmacium glaucopus]|nr:hypothetical protein BYT27DRAFT_7080848 [Phlegmacium glaucopus]